MYEYNNQYNQSPLIRDNNNNISELYKEQYYNKTNENNNNDDNLYNHDSLRESIWDSINRDLTRIWLKMKVVIFPRSKEEKQKELRQWDLWGPFIICLILGTFTSVKSSGLVFSTIFIIIWVGAMIITMNSSLLGGTMSLMQCICLLGYCSFPVTLAALLNRVILKFLPGIAKIIIVIISFVWSSKASISFIAQNIPEKKKILAVYPVILYFVYLNYFILV